MLRNFDFPNASDAIAIHLGKTKNDSLIIPDLIATTQKNTFIEKNPPSVVFIMMEGLSNYYINLHSAENNLLGSLEAQLNDCYVYRNFLPSYNGTIYSLENLLVGTPQSPLSQSKFQTVIS